MQLSGLALLNLGIPRLDVLLALRTRPQKAQTREVLNLESIAISPGQVGRCSLMALDWMACRGSKCKGQEGPADPETSNPQD